MASYREKVRTYLLTQVGVKEERVEALLVAGADEISSGERFVSQVYYVADRIMETHGSDDDIVPGFVPPPEDEDEDDDDGDN